MYKVIARFNDLQDFNHPYYVGDIFPRNGMVVNKERLAELSSDKNLRKIPLIKFVEEKKVEVVEEPKTEFTKTEINRMSKADLVKLATESGIEVSDDMNGSVLKGLLIEKYNL